MSTGPGLNIRKIAVFFFVLSGFPLLLFSQEEISGVVNVYRKVTAIGTSPRNNVTLSSVDSVVVGDTVMLIQMQGVKIDTSDSSYGEAYYDDYGTPGAYEILLIGSIDTNAKKVFFTRLTQNDYDVRGSVQLVRIPYYDKARVKGKLTARPWNRTSGVGGVLSLIVGSRLEIDAATGLIDVSGKGFTGGFDTTGIGQCIDGPDYNLYSKKYFPRSFKNAGYKGEGVANYSLSGQFLYPAHAKGQGPLLTGGGGGNGKYSGGGGGSNRGAGSQGFFEMSGCANPLPGALGGSAALNSIYLNGIFMGGGGGSSTRSSGSGVSNGGNGGGIIVILTDTLSGQGRYIRADGLSAANVSGNAGGGGGGAGGSVLLSLRSFSKTSSDSVKISVRGGNGGWRDSEWGSGGGGGGGLVAVSLPQVTGKIRIDTAWGTPKDNTPNIYDGDLIVNIIPNVNGFLFNSIRSEVTGNQSDSICSNVPFGKIAGTVPIGGQGPYTFTWEKSTVSETGPWTTISGAVSIDYTPGLLTQTTWFRRKVSDSSTPVINDFSVPVKVLVHQAITGNTVGRDTTICFNQNPLALVPLNSGPSNGNGIYSYVWLKNLADVSTWDTTMTASGVPFRNAYYDPAALANTTFYKRVVVSGRCISYSPTVKITVLPSITNNIISNPDNQNICQPSFFANLAGQNTGGGAGAGSYLYTWQESLNNTTWQTASGATQHDPVNRVYDPSEPSSSSVVTRYFRRFVVSGPYNTCRDSTLSVRLIQYPRITGNFITKDDGSSITSSLCQDGSRNLSLRGSVPAGGDGSYTYTWKRSVNGSTWPDNVGSEQNLSTPAPSDMNFYGRVVISAGGLCTDETMANQTVLVHRIPVANAGPDREICGGTVTLSALLSVGGDTDTGWEFFRNGADIKDYGAPSSPVARVKIDSSFFSSSAKKDMYFSWREVNGVCSDWDSVKISFYTRVRELGPDRDTALYSFDGILHMNAVPLSSARGETGLWTVVSGSSSLSDAELPTALAANLEEGQNSYRWTVTNKNGSATAICSDSYLYIVNLYNIFIPNVFSPNGDGLYDEFTIKGVDLGNQRAELRILNSAGAEVYSTSNTGGGDWQAWNGMDASGKTLPEGTYYYLLKLTSWGMDMKYDTSDDQVYKKSGFIILKRYSQGSK